MPYRSCVRSGLTMTAPWGEQSAGSGQYDDFCRMFFNSVLLVSVPWHERCAIEESLSKLRAIRDLRLSDPI